jgi:hypothetical protein
MLGRNKNGLLEGLPGDWIFIDWATGLSKGEVSFEQLLFAKPMRQWHYAQILQMINKVHTIQKLSATFVNYFHTESAKTSIGAAIRWKTNG